MRQGALATVEQGAGEVVEGALAVSATVAFAPGAVVRTVPGIDVVALTARTLKKAIFPAETMGYIRGRCRHERAGGDARGSAWLSISYEDMFHSETNRRYSAYN